MSVSASNGLRVAGQSQTSLRGRIGIRTGLRFTCGDKIIEPFAAVWGVNEFLGGNRVSTDEDSFNPTFSGPQIQAARNRA